MYGLKVLLSGYGSAFLYRYIRSDIISNMEVDKNLLQYILNNDIINLDDVRESMRKEERKRLLSLHRYKIFQDKDGRWKTTLPDETKKSGRRLIAKSELRDLEDAVVEYYKGIQRESDRKVIQERMTLREIYPLWLQSRRLEVNSMGTVKKNDQDWKRYYLQDSIIDKPMCELTVQELKDWAHKKIEDHHMNKRSYYNMAIIMKQCFQYAKDAEYIDDNTWEKVKINTKKLKRNQKKSNEEEVYFLDEQKKLIGYSFEQFNNNPRNITALAIPFIFVTGLRIGELVCLKYDDIDEEKEVIRISKSESVIYNLDEDGGFTYNGKEVLEHAKTDAGERDIPYTTYAKQIVQMVKSASEQYGYYDEGYIFCPRSKRIMANSIDKKPYNYCNAINVDKKSAHKIRKTFISRLIHSGQIDIDTVCRVAGHMDMKTTFMSYCFSLDHESAIQNKFEDVLRIG